MSYKLLIATVLAIPAASWAQGAPDQSEVQDRESETEPQSELETVDRELAEARAELARLSALADSDEQLAEQAAEDLQTARSDRNLNETVSGATVDTAWYDVEEAQEQLSAAKQSRKVQKTELKLAKQRGDREEISRARSALTSSKKEVASTRAAVAVAQSQYRKVKGDEGQKGDASEQAVASARMERSSAADRVDITDQQLEIARARVAALEAVRARVMAETEYERANKAGEMHQLDMLKKALQDAREAETNASARLKELEAS
jgi:chromosome segregation ATPase